MNRDFAWLNAELANRLGPLQQRTNNPNLENRDVLREEFTPELASQLSDEGIIHALEHYEPYDGQPYIGVRSILRAEQARRNGKVQNRTLKVAIWTLAVAVITLVATILMPMVD